MGINNNRKSLIKVIDNVNNHLERIVALESNSGSGSGDCLEQSIDIQPFKGIASEDWEAAKAAGESVPETQDQVVSMSATNVLQSSIESTIATAFRVKYNLEPRILALESNSNSITETTIIQRSNTMSNGKYEFYPTGDKDFTVTTIDDLAYIMDQNDTITYMVVNSNTERIKTLETSHNIDPSFSTTFTHTVYPCEAVDGIIVGFSNTSAKESSTNIRDVIQSLSTDINRVRSVARNGINNTFTTMCYQWRYYNSENSEVRYEYNLDHNSVKLEDVLLNFIKNMISTIADIVNPLGTIFMPGTTSKS